MLLVTLTQGTKVVAHQSGHSIFHFRLTVAPGTYVISSKGTPFSETVTVQANRTTTVNLPQLCRDNGSAAV